MKFTLKITPKMYIYFVIFALVLADISCKSSLSVQPKTDRNLPQNYYAQTADSSNSASEQRQKFFSDSILVSLIDTLLNNNLDIFAAAQRIEIAKATVRQTKGARLPVVDGLIAPSQRKFGKYTMDYAGNSTTEIQPGKLVPEHLPDYLFGVQSTWEADIWGKLKNKKQAATHRFYASVEGKNLITTQLVASLANAYYNLVSIDNELEIIKETIQLLQNAVELVTTQKKAGAANELAVKQFEALLINSKALEFDVLQQLTETENLINFLLNRYPQPVIRKKIALNQNLPFVVNMGLPSDLLKNRPDIKQAQLNLLATKADLKAAQKSFYPLLNVTANLGLQGFNPALVFSTPQSVAYTLLAGITTPLINRSALKAQFKTANAVQLEALFDYQKTIMSSYMEVNNKLANISNLQNVYTLKTSEVSVLLEAISTAILLFRSGKATYIEVLMTQRSSLAAQLELVSTRQKQFNGLIDLYKALGGGWR